MNYNRPISDFIATGEPIYSVEFFPPKNEEGAQQILQTAQLLKDKVPPQFVSITYGAGGTTRELTLKYAIKLKDDYGFQVMPHLTCVGHSREELLYIVGEFQKNGLCNVMALRGDPPKGETTFTPHPRGLTYASELVSLIRENFSGFSLGVAGYPQKHPEAGTIEEDILHLKHKVDCGASFITTQLFFENKYYFDFVKRCREADIRVPIIPGILPPLSLQQAQRLCQLSKMNLPAALEKELVSAGNDSETQRKIGINWAYEQIKELLSEKAPGFHLYILNRAQSASELISRLQQEKRIRNLP